jgi:hypothetical protein
MKAIRRFLTRWWLALFVGRWTLELDEPETEDPDHE